jgi:hypothetical protein
VASCCELPEASDNQSCHGPGQLPHFAPPDRDWYALPFLVPPGLILVAFTQEPYLGTNGRLAALPQPPPEKPPRLFS